MSKIPFFFVDVFAETKLAGNQLAVFIEAGDLSTPQMQAIAKEIHFSETTFITSREKKNGGYDVRIFTPEEEIPFAGHPTLGTAYMIQQEIEKEPQSQILLNMQVGQIPVTMPPAPDGVLWMKQNPPEFGAILDKADFADSLHIDPALIHPQFPIQEVSTGLPVIIVPIRSLPDLQNLSIHVQDTLRYVKDKTGKGIFAFCLEAEDPTCDIHARFFADYFGIPEDPATGSANGCLAGYLLKHSVIHPSAINLTVEQGIEIKRPSRLYLRADCGSTHFNIYVGGKVQTVAQGFLEVS
jgi:trans-2,3-dihydro-3-hydroxyanthranilate isomerase